MFFGADNVKIKNFFALCDKITSSPQPTRKFLAETASISYPTVAKTVEILLDLGILKEKLLGKSYVYRFSEKLIVGTADLRGNVFRMIFTDLGGTELYSFKFRESDTFFFDEKLSLFFSGSAIAYKRRFPKERLIGISVILPSLSQRYRDTRGILTSRERMRELVSSFYPSVHTVVMTGTEAAAELCSDMRSVILMYESRRVLCRLSSYGVDKTSVLKSVSTTALGKCKSSAELAAQLAYAVGNICDVLSPELILVDGERMFSASAFPQNFKAALARYNCTSEDELPEIRHTKGELAMLGAVRHMRCLYITEKLKENGRQI